ncbi:hypothetical protein J1605_003246 [Eschrichtius robustus]|uniref:Uncharacterized protein n=1 Tax=Eschrichtius robustus TaxID=9764 RepID=A0AB34HS72_ESCRO|nr:hypothetical protein J1605_003246 [Eschrichtius robustus]
MVRLVHREGETEAGAGGGGSSAGVAGGAELRGAAPDAPTPTRLSGAGQGKDSRLRGSRRCQCGGFLTLRPGPPSSSLPRSLPSAPECGGTASFRAARLPPDLSARVSGGRGRLLKALAFPARLLPAGRTWARSWRRGPAPARKLESFVFAPRPARRGEEGGAEAALGRPRAGRAPALASAPGFFRLSLSGWVCGFPEAIKTGPASLPTGLSASSAPLSRLFAAESQFAFQ